MGESKAKRIADSVLIVGLDGATFDVLGPMMDKGVMPNLKSIVDTGASGILNSTKPPITPAAWTTFMTGMGPGKHGVIDFERYEPATNTLAFNSMFQIQQKTIWQMLSEKNFKVGSLHLPMTYPPRPVNGFMVSGFETPSIEVDFTFPKELKAEIFKEIPDYTYSTNWKRGLFGGRSCFDENLEYFKLNFRQNVKLAQLCTEKYGWEAMMVLFKLVDNIQHKTWQFIDPKNDGKYPEKQAKVYECFKVLDDCLGDLMELAKKQGATLLIMSDHGHGSLDGKAQPNLSLKNWGFLKLVSNASQTKTRLSWLGYRLFKKKRGRFKQGNVGIEKELAIDWSKTKACVMHAGMYGFLYLNLKGRQPDGVVEPYAYEQVRNELIEKFTQARDEKFNEPIYTEVVKPEELYKCSREEHPDMPDLMLIPRAGLAVVRKIRGSKAVKWALDGRLGGTHRIEGIFLAQGPSVKAGVKVEGNIADITPTLLAMLGQKVPSNMEGKAITDIFDPPLPVEFMPAEKYEASKGPDDVFSKDEKDMLTERLTDLGYLE